MQKLNNVWKNRLVTTCGFLILIMPLLGFPHSWSDKFYFILGLIIVVVSFQLGRFLVYGDEETTPTLAVGAPTSPEASVGGKVQEKIQERPKQERKHKTHAGTPVQPITQEKPVTSDWDNEEEKSV